MHTTNMTLKLNMYQIIRSLMQINLIFCYYLSTNHTLTSSGERHTLVNTSSMNITTHSHAIQLMILTEGERILSLYITVKETVGNTFVSIIKQ